MKRFLIILTVLVFFIPVYSQNTFSCGGFEYEKKSAEGDRIEIYVRGPFGGAAILPGSNIHNMVDIEVVPLHM